MSIVVLRILLLVCLISLVGIGWVRAESYDDDFRMYEFPRRPSPAWVRLVDQGARDPRLKGFMAPAGIRVEIVAEEPAVINPVGIAFHDSGDLYALEWVFADSADDRTYEVKFQDGTSATVLYRWKKTLDPLKKLVDEDGDRVYESSEVVMDDLELPSSVLFHEGWSYFPSIGHVVRRRLSEPGVEEEILRGLCGSHHHQVSGLSLSPDGWLFVSSGDNDNRAEGSDGSRSIVLRSGVIFRSRPDGSQVAEFARGFRNPYRNVAFDHLGNVFHVDNDQEEGSKFQGVRLMHVPEASDFGWRLRPGSGCCQVDTARASYWGEVPGTVPGMIKTGRGAPAGLTIYQGVGFPEFFRGLLIYPDLFRKLVRAYRVEKAGSSFRVVEQFNLLSSREGLFRPTEAVVGPDGALYICDWRTNGSGAGQTWGNSKNGRIYRLSWEGLAGAPAIAPASRKSWSEVPGLADEQLAGILDGPDYELRQRAVRELARRVKRGASGFSFVDFSLDRARTLEGRAAAIGGSCRFYSASVQEAMLRLLGDSNADLRRLACDAISRHVTRDLVDEPLLDALSGLVVYEVSNAVQRAASLALGSALSLLHPESTPARASSIVLVMALEALDHGDPHLRQGVIQAIGRSGVVGLNRLHEMILGEDPRLKESAVGALESLRTRAAASLIDEILAVDLETLSEDQWVRLLTAYRYVIEEPPHSMAPLTEWLASHPEAPPRAQMAALESIGLSREFSADVGDSKLIEDAALRLLSHNESATRIAATRAIGNAKLKSLSKNLVTSLADTSRDVTERRVIVEALGRLRAEKIYFKDERTAPGVETVLDEVIAIAGDPAQGEVRADIVTLLGQIDFTLAKPLARRWLESDDDTLVLAALGVLGTYSTEALAIARLFLEGKLGRHFLPQVAELLRRHAAKDTEGEFAPLLAMVLQGGQASEADEKRLNNLIASGDAEKGRTVFLDVKRTQCLTCHRLGGLGGQVGPDLTGIGQNLTTDKIVESLLTPSAEIKEGYSAWTIVTLEGQLYNGLLVSETDRLLTLRDLNGKDILVPIDNVVQRIESKSSLMPDGLVAQLSLEEIADLVAFLSNQTAQVKLRE